MTRLAALSLFLLLLAGCGKPSVSGTYVGKDTNVVAVVDLVASSGGQITGRLEGLTLNPDGTLHDINASLTGISDGNRVSLAVRPNAFISASIETTGELKGDHLILSVPNVPTSLDFVRSDMATFQDEAGRLRKQSETLLAARAEAQARAQAAARRSAFLAGLGQLSARVDQLAGTLGRVQTGPAQIEAAYSRITARMSALLQRERALTGPDERAVQRGQWDVAIHQGSVMTDQLHIQAQSATAGLTVTAQQLNSDIRTALASCGGAGGFPPDAELTSACNGLAAEARRLSDLTNRRDLALRSLEVAYAREANEQREIVAEADRSE